MANILAIDDNAVIRDVITFTLHYHHNITVVNSGKEGISLARASQFDVIITDINMPEMNGVEFVKELRKIHSYATTPILMLTADLEENTKKIKGSGATAWMLKPFEPSKLLEKVDELVK